MVPYPGGLYDSLIMTGKPLVLLGSARSDGETRRAVDLAFGDRADVIDLRDYTVGPYDYAYANAGDDFLKIIDLLLARQTIVFATPVYWYAMSASMKTLFDRLTDLITVEKPKGRALAGKTAYLLVSGSGEALPEGFEMPFAETCSYFAIDYRGAGYLYTGDDPARRTLSEDLLKAFGLMITR